MTRLGRAGAWTGLACLAVGVALPWAQVTGVAGSSHVSGWGHGAELASILAVGCAVSYGLRHDAVALVCALLGLGWTGYVFSDLLGALLAGTAGAYRADIGIGCGLMLLGFLILAAGATARVTATRPLALEGSEG